MNAAFPDALVQGWKHLVSDMDNDPGDRHVAAVAVAAEADAIVTLNARDFRGAVLASHGIRILTPAELVTHCLDDLPERVLHAVSEIRAGFV
ncbi:MAG: PIN domain-containing protein, partial [Pseudonocardiaceae bacterium]